MTRRRLSDSPEFTGGEAMTQLLDNELALGLGQFSGKL